MSPWSGPLRRRSLSARPRSLAVVSLNWLMRTKPNPGFSSVARTLFTWTLPRTSSKASGAGAPAWEPPIDIYERSDGLLIEIALPGVAIEDVRLEFVDGVLVLRAQRRLLQCQGGAQIRRLEIPYGLFERRLALPPGWSFRSRVVEHDLEVTAVDGVAYVVQDELGNTYQRE